MSTNQAAAEKAVIAISADHEGWTGTGLDLKLAAGVIEAAIDEETRPLEEALREARKLLTVEYGLKRENVAIVKIDAALAQFEKEPEP